MNGQSVLSLFWQKMDPMVMDSNANPDSPHGGLSPYYFTKNRLISQSILVSTLKICYQLLITINYFIIIELT